jgi:hypothetical protein
MIDRSTLSPEDAAILDIGCDYAALRRDRNRAAGNCVNENRKGTHGPATNGVRCEACHEKRKAQR